MFEIGLDRPQCFRTGVYDGNVCWLGLDGMLRFDENFRAIFGVTEELV